MKVFTSSLLGLGALVSVVAAQGTPSPTHDPTLAPTVPIQTVVPATVPTQYISAVETATSGSEAVVGASTWETIRNWATTYFATAQNTTTLSQRLRGSTSAAVGALRGSTSALLTFFKSIFQSQQVFGLPIGSQVRVPVEGYAEDIPQVLVQLRNLLAENNGFSTEGVFRVPPESVVLTEAVDLINRGRVEDVDNDPILIAALIKRWFRELPTPILDSIDSLDTGSVEDLPEPSQSVVLFLLDTLVQVDESSSLTIHHSLAEDHSLAVVLSCHSLAVVFAPNVRSPLETLDPREAMAHNDRVVEFLEAELRLRV